MSVTFRLVLLAAVVGSLHAAEGIGEPIHYWNGDQRVEAWLALDRVVMRAGGRVEVLPMAGRAALAKRLGKGKAHAVIHQRVRGRIGKPEALSARLSLRPKAGRDLAALAARHGLAVVEAVPYAADTWILAAADPLAALTAANALYEGGDAVFAAPLVARRLEARAATNDPRLGQQWHLPLIGAAAAWDVAQGAGVNIAIVDDGLDLAHPDLDANVRTGLDIDLNDGDADPVHGPEGGHGTIVGGIAAADGDDGVGTAGVAHAAGLVGVRLIAAPVTDAEEALAMNHGAAATVDTQRVHVSNNSWGYVGIDNVPIVVAPGPLMRAALEHATRVGRGGLGTVFCWAAGNDGEIGDSCAYDGYVGNRYTIGVSACGSDGRLATYSEYGCNIMLTAPGGETGTGMVAPVRGGGFSTAAEGRQGTSFASPVVAGVAALVLDADPTLTWRDVMDVLLRTAVENDPGEAGWTVNGAGLPFNHRYGFGLVAADAATTAVANGAWRTLPASAAPIGVAETVPIAIPDDDAGGVVRELSVAAPAGFRAEHVELTVDVRHPYRGDLAFELTAPSGQRSIIPRRDADLGSDFSNWTFTSVAHWGEPPAGTWRLRVVDGDAEVVGTLDRWSLRIHGYLAPAEPTIDAIVPGVIVTGSADTVIAVTGTGFDSESEVCWGGTALATTFVSATRLDATVPAALLASAGLCPVTVRTPPSHGAGGGTSSAHAVRVTGRPTLAGLPATRATAEDTASAAIALTVADDDVAAAALTVAATSSAGAVVPASGLRLSGTGATRSLVLVPNPDAVGSTAITVTVSDGFVTSSPAVMTFTVTPVGDLPVAVDAAFATRPGVALAATVTGSDPDGTPVVFSLAAPAAAHGTATISPAGALAYQPAPGFTGLDRLGFTVASDGDSAAPASVLIAVDDPALPRARFVSEPAEETIPAGDPWTCTMVVDRRELTVLDSLRFTLVDAPAGMTFAGGGASVTVAAPGDSAALTWTAGGTDAHVPVAVLVECVPGGGRGIDVQRFLLRVVSVSATE